MLKAQALFSLACTVAALCLSGCERAARYPATAAVKQPDAKPAAPNELPPIPPHHGWLPVEPAYDIPIVFVDEQSRPKEWAHLPDYWNHLPPPFAGMRTLHVGQQPLAAAVAMAAANHGEVIKIKVPRGLPDPTPNIPESNPATFAKWHLGRQLFFDDGWLTAEGGLSCASCHRPEHGYSEKLPPLRKPRMNAPSLINAVYRRHQFWDGRAAAMEEVLFRPSARESASDLSSANVAHSWHGIVPRLSRRREYVEKFSQVFGIQQPTVDAAAKALATYMRTILSGNSLYDRAARAAQKHGGTPLAVDFEAHLTEEALDALQRAGKEKQAVAGELERGQRLFFSSATRCAVCHAGWNFTDEGFHNVGIRESDDPQPLGKETGRFRWLPWGLKDARLIGAYRTPSLRNLPRTDPYFHDGSADTLEKAVSYYNDGIHNNLNLRLDPLLLDEPGKARRLNLTEEEVRALALFLRALDGEAVPAVVAAPPRK